MAAKRDLLFHTNDLANWWLIFNKNTLRVTLKRYVEQKLLHRIYRGFYSLLPVEEIDPLLIGSRAIHRFCYLSTETVLYRKGIISQKIDPFTFVSEKSLQFTIGPYRFFSRQLQSLYLYSPEGIQSQDGLFVATLQRAIADLLYFDPFYHFDRPINWKQIYKMQQKIGYPLTLHRYDFAKTR